MLTVVLENYFYDVHDVVHVHTTRYLLGISFVMFSMFCIPMELLLIRTTSSMYRMYPNLGCVVFVFTPRSYLLIYSAISSITVAYISTESTPPCLMLSLILISLVFIHEHHIVI